MLNNNHGPCHLLDVIKFGANCKVHYCKTAREHDPKSAKCIFCTLAEAWPRVGLVARFIYLNVVPIGK